MQVALSDKEGLPQNSVYSIAQTNDGYLWFGTEEGLARFDGVRVTVMNTLKNKTLVDNYVNVLTAGRDGSLWVGTRSGVIRYKDGIFRTYFSPGSPINSILEDRNGRIWIGSMAGLYSIHDDQVRRYTARDGLPNAGIRAIVADSRGVLWLATTEGLVSLANDQFRTYSFRDGVPAAPILALASSHDGSLWIATTDGLVRWRGKLLQRWSAADFPAQARIASLLEDRDGVLWLGFEHHGIASVWQGQIKRYTTLQGLPSDEVDRIFEDQSGHLWIGLLEGGVLELRDGPFSAIGKREGLSTDMVWSVLQSRDGSLWVGTDGNGLNHIDRKGKVHVYTVADGLPDNTIFALCEAGDGTIWIGSEGGALTRYDRGRFTRYRDPEAKDSRLAEILQGPGGSDLWLGFHGKNGLVRFHDGRFQHYTVPGLLNAMAFAPDGAIWVGTDHGSVSRVKDGLVTNYTTAQGLLSDFAQAIYVDRDGVVWAGTSPGGLNRIKNGHVTTYSVAQGLFDLTVGAIVEDTSGNLWMTCNHGIFRVSKQELNDYAEGRVHAIHSVVYGTADGLRAAECNFAAYPAVWQGSSGRLWFATVGGVASIDPRHMQNRRADPQIQIERVLVNQNVVRSEGASIIGRGGDDLEVQYTAPDFTAPDRLRFRYRLLHFDRDWVNVGGRREAYYTKLPPGRYVFEAQVAEENGEWTPSSESFALVLQPRFWQTDWFKIASALIIVSLFGALVKLRVRYLEARTLDLEERVNRRTKELQEAIKAAEDAQEALRELATKDGLTGLWNRRAIFELLDREILRGGRENFGICVLMADLDHFKLINDKYGHLAGDSVLEEVARRVTELARPYDLVGRYGGEELLIVLPDCTLLDGMKRAEEFRSVIASHPIDAGPQSIPVSCSFGVAVGANMAPAEALIAEADMALYQAKRSGRNCVHALFGQNSTLA